MKVRVQKLHPDAVLPTYASDGAACFDLRTIEAGEVGIARAEYQRHLQSVINQVRSRPK